MILRPFKIAVATFCALTLLAACAPNPPMQATPQLTFSNLAPIKLNVGQIEIVDESRPTGRSPHIEHEMPVAPSVAVQRWVQDRLQPVGSKGMVRVVIRQAEALEEPLATDHGVMGIFKSEQSSRIRMSIDVAIQLLDERQFAIADASASAMRARTMPEGLKLNERDNILYEMVEDMMKGFNQEIEPRIQSNLHQIVAY